MEYTQNYQLPLWDKEDAIKRTDFNDNNSKIDAAIAAAKTEAANALAAYKSSNNAALAAAKTEASNALANYKTTNDAAVTNLASTVPKIAVGTYTGNGSTSEATVINVGFAPKMVLIWNNSNGGTSSNYSVPNYCGMAVAGNPLYNMLTLTTTGFQVVNRMQSGYSYYPVLNAQSTYFYFAIG